MSYDTDPCPLCGERKNEDYDHCFVCAQKIAEQEGRLCKCGKFKKVDFPQCFTCYQTSAGKKEEASEEFIPDEGTAPGRHAGPETPARGQGGENAFQSPAVPVQSLLFLDTETTGFKAPRLVQLSFVHTGGTQCRNLLFRPPIQIEVGATKVHGISDERVQKEQPFNLSPTFFVLQELLEKSVLIAHSAAYDVGVLKNEGLRVPWWICTCSVAKAMMPRAKNHKLQGLREQLEIEVEGAAHEAWGDVCVLMEVFRRLLGAEQVRTCKRRVDIIHDFLAYSRARV